MEQYSGFDEIPHGDASDILTPGCLVLEGGAWRGLYTQGVLDALMENDINFETTIGVSAGAMSAMGYVAGQIGRCARINLRHRHDPKYVGIGAYRVDHGITGFTYLFDTLSEEEPFRDDRFYDPRRRFYAVATNLETGEAEYFEKSSPDILQAIRASATVPYISEPVEISGSKYLDGGCAVRVPLPWALEHDYEKIVVVRTRARDYRKSIIPPLPLIEREYRNYPRFQKCLREERVNYNVLLDMVDAMEENGRIFVIAPSQPVRMARFEKDLEVLGNLWKLGYEDAKEILPALKKYLEK